MNERVFLYKLLNLRKQAVELLSEPLTGSQLCDVGIELETHTRTILDQFRERGALYRSRD